MLTTMLPIDPASTPMIRRCIPALILAGLLSSATLQAAAAPVEDYAAWSEIGEPQFVRWRAPAAAFDAPRFQEAVAAYKSGALAAGDALAAAQTLPEARAALEWAAIRSARATLGSARLIAFLTTHPGFPMERWIRRRIETALLDEKAAVPKLRSFFDGYRPGTAAGHVLLALVNRADGKAGMARSGIVEAWRETSVPKGVEAFIDKSFPETIRSDDVLYRAELLTFLRQPAEATRVARRLGDGAVALVKAVGAAAAQSDDADRLLVAVPPAYRRRSSFLLAEAQQLRRAGRLHDAAKTMLRAARDSHSVVSGEDWWTERRLLSRSLLDLGDAQTAYAVASGYRATEDANRIDAEFQSGWIALRYLDDAEAAEVHFARAARLASTPLSIARANYWLGRAREAGHGDARIAYQRAALYGAAFYGQLAQDRLGGTALRLRDRPAGDIARVAFEALSGARVIRVLLDQGFRELALPLATDYAQTLNTAEEASALAELLLDYRDPNLLLTVAKLSAQRGFGLDRHAFPLFGVPWFEPVTGSADGAMVHAIARQESAFNPAAVSHAGARGLMQMMPATAAATARQFKLSVDTDQLTRDPQSNARLGAAHLGHLMATHRSSPILVFAAYNAGPGRVKEWIEAHGDPRDPGVDMVDWIERIPITETRNYVQRVMENMQVYRALLTGDPTLRIGADLARGTRPFPAEAELTTGSTGRSRTRRPTFGPR